jgi:hypothetical protein
MGSLVVIGGGVIHGLSWKRAMFDKNLDGEGAQFPTRSPPGPQLWLVVSLGEMQGWARREGHRVSEVVIALVCVGVLCRDWLGAESWPARTRNASD